MSEDQIDSLNDGESVKINCDIPGQYTKTQKDGNLSAPNSFFTLTVIELEIVIEGGRLKIVGCNSIASVNQY